MLGVAALFPPSVSSFLDRPLHGVLATHDPRGGISQSVVWHKRFGEKLWISCDANSVKVRHIKQDSRISLLVLAPHGGAYVRVEAIAEVGAEVTKEQRLELVTPHFGADAQHWINEHPLDGPQLLVTINPVHVVSRGVT